MKTNVNYEKMLKEVLEEYLADSNNSKINLPIIYSLLDKIGEEKGFEIIDKTVYNFFIFHNTAKTKNIISKIKNNYQKRTVRKFFWENCKSLNIQEMKHFYFEVEAYIYSDVETRNILFKSLYKSANKLTELEKRQIVELVYITTENYYTEDINLCDFNEKFLKLTH